MQGWIVVQASSMHCNFAFISSNGNEVWRFTQWMQIASAFIIQQISYVNWELNWELLQAGRDVILLIYVISITDFNLVIQKHKKISNVVIVFSVIPINVSFKIRISTMLTQKPKLHLSLRLPLSIASKNASCCRNINQYLGYCLCLFLYDKDKVRNNYAWICIQELHAAVNIQQISRSCYSTHADCSQ